MQSLVFFLFLAISLFSFERETSYPYLSGDTWRFFADHRLSKEADFDPKNVRLGDVVFVEPRLLSRFRKKYISKIKERFILVTPNDEEAGDNPQPDRFENLLKSKKIAYWFLQNIDRAPSERLVPIPIGLANQVWKHGRVSVLEEKRGLLNEKRNFLYLNFSLDTNHKARSPCFEYFRQFKSAFIPEVKDFGGYLTDLASSKFVVSPPGNGLDCHRTWETLLMGSYPIVLSSTLNPLYQNLPVIVVSSWDEITVEFLEEKEREFSASEFEMEKLFAPYWFQKVTKLQQHLRKNPTFMERYRTLLR